MTEFKRDIRTCRTASCSNLASGILIPGHLWYCSAGGLKLIRVLLAPVIWLGLPLLWLYLATPSFLHFLPSFFNSTKLTVGQLHVYLILFLSSPPTSA